MNAMMMRLQGRLLCTAMATIACLLTACTETDNGIGLELEWSVDEPPEGYEVTHEEFAHGHTHDELDDEPEDPEEGARSTPRYHLPFASGETYRATTYDASWHRNAWDFNFSSGPNDDCGEPVVAVTDGTVGVARNTSSGGFGKYVRLHHDNDGNRSYYAHLSEVFVTQGQWVERGQALGRIGTTGNSTGCHLHFEVRNGNGTQLRPRFRYIQSGSTYSGFLSHNGRYRSWNHGEMTRRRQASGGANIGTSSTKAASRVDYEGFVRYFVGGNWGPTAIYYQALGCEGARCNGFNNTNDAWVVRMGFYDYFHDCGGPRYCWLGFPTGNEYGISGGTRQNFEFGYLTWNNNDGVRSHSY